MKQITVRVERYKDRRMNPPHEFIMVDSFSVPKTEFQKWPADIGPALVLRKEVLKRNYGFPMQFYTTKDGADYIVVLDDRTSEDGHSISEFLSPLADRLMLGEVKSKCPHLLGEAKEILSRDGVL